MPIPAALGRDVAREAGYRCGYCLCAEAVGIPLEFDHLLPIARGGQTKRANLWLACTRCNKIRSDRIRASDPLTRRIFRLFNPRRDEWFDHFRWVDDGLRIAALTAIGRATVAALRLNSTEHVFARGLWIRAGVHPPRT
jgi:hypothetical protein